MSKLNHNPLVIKFLWPISILIFTSAFLFLLNENPFNVAKIIWQSATSSRFDLGMTLFYSTHFILTGLAVSLCFKVGLFNVGAEGQLTFGTAVGTAASLLSARLGYFTSILIGTLMGIVAGGFWAFIPAYLKIKRGAHEVITTIMMNFIAAGLASYLIIIHFSNPDSQRPESAVVPAFDWLRSHDLLAQSFEGSPVSFVFILAVFLCLAADFILMKTPLGYLIRATGAGFDAAEVGQIPVRKIQLSVFTIAGAIAGLTVLTEVIGGVGQYKLGFSADYGFTAIAVALIAGNRPYLIILSGLLFGVLHKGASGLDFESDVLTKDFSYILQSLLILFIIVRGRVKNEH